MELRTIVLSKKHPKPCQELFEFFYKKFLSNCFITANRPEEADCGEWLLFSDIVRNNLPSELEGKKRSFAAGAISGATAAVITYPLATFKDYVLLQATIAGSKLHIPSSFYVAKEVMGTVIADPKVAFKKFGVAALKQAPLRIGMTAAVFSMVNGIGDVLGDDPVGMIFPRESSYRESKQSTFFGSSPRESRCRIEEIRDDEVAKSDDKTRMSTPPTEPPKPA